MGRAKYLIFGIVLVLGVIAGCAQRGDPPEATVAPASATTAAVTTPAPSASMSDLAIIAFNKGGCVGCHIIPGIANAKGTIGPDLTNIGQRALQTMQSGTYTGKATTVEEYLREALLEPDVYISTHCENGPCSAGVMTASARRCARPAPPVA